MIPARITYQIVPPMTKVSVMALTSRGPEITVPDIVVIAGVCTSLTLQYWDMEDHLFSICPKWKINGSMCLNNKAC